MTEYVWCNGNDCNNCALLEVEQSADDTGDTNDIDDTPMTPDGRGFDIPSSASAFFLTFRIL